MKKSIVSFYDILILVIFVGFILFFLYKQFLIDNKKGKVLLIITEKERYKYSLDDNKFIEINGKIGKTIIEIKDNKFRFKDSSCLNKNCVKTGWVSIVNYPVICLPNMVTAYIESEKEQNDFDIITR